MRRLDRLGSSVVAEGALNSPFFSPDGSSIGFYEVDGAQVNLLRVPAEGGASTTICPLPGGGLSGASWGTNGTIVFGTNNPTSGLWRVPAVGGDPELLTTPDSDVGEIDHVWPTILPDGRHVLFTILGRTVGQSQIAVLSLETGERTIVLRGGTYPRFLTTGHLLYAVSGNLWVVAFDPGSEADCQRAGAGVAGGAR